MAEKLTVAALQQMKREGKKVAIKEQKGVRRGQETVCQGEAGNVLCHQRTRPE